MPSTYVGGNERAKAAHLIANQTLRSSNLPADSMSTNNNWLFSLQPASQRQVSSEDLTKEWRELIEMCCEATASCQWHVGSKKAFSLSQSDESAIRSHSVTDQHHCFLSF